MNKKEKMIAEFEDQGFEMGQNLTIESNGEFVAKVKSLSYEDDGIKVEVLEMDEKLNRKLGSEFEVGDAIIIPY